MHKLEILLYRIQFKKVFDTLNTKQKKEWQEKRAYLESVCLGNLHPFEWLCKIESVAYPELSIKLDRLEEFLSDLLDLVDYSSSFVFFEELEKHIPGYTKKSLKSRVFLISLKIKEIEDIQSAYELAYQDRDWFNAY